MNQNYFELNTLDFHLHSFTYLYFNLIIFHHHLAILMTALLKL